MTQKPTLSTPKKHVKTFSKLGLLFGFLTIFFALVYGVGAFIVALTAQAQGAEWEEISTIVSYYTLVVNFIYLAFSILFTIFGILTCVNLHKADASMTANFLMIPGMAINLIFNITGIVFNVAVFQWFTWLFFGLSSIGTIVFIVGCFMALKAVK